MKISKLILSGLFILVLCACSPKETELPLPGELFDQISASAQLPEMIDTAADMLQANTGIAPEDYTEAVYYIPAEGMAADEIIIIRARDSAGVSAIEEKLKSWLTYREESAQVYLTEYMPLIKSGIIRSDGLTVSLIVSEQVEAILEVYNSFK